MGDDSKVVPGTEVKFEGGSAEFDALQSPAEPGMPRPPEPETPFNEVHLALTQFIANVDQTIKREKSFPGSKVWPHLTTLAPYLRFQSDMSVTFTPIPKRTLLSLIEAENPTLGKLLNKTDLGQEFPDQYDLHASLPDIVGELGYRLKMVVMDNVEEMEGITKNRLIIPSGYFISLFLENGKTYRRFLKHSGKDNEVKTYLELNKLGNRIIGFQREPFIDPENLHQFVEETGETRVGSLVRNLQDLDNYLNNMEIDESLSLLYTRLKQYHPELTI